MLFSRQNLQTLTYHMPSITVHRKVINIQKWSGFWPTLYILHISKISTSYRYRDIWSVILIFISYRNWNPDIEPSLDSSADKRCTYLGLSLSNNFGIEYSFEYLIEYSSTRQFRTLFNAVGLASNKKWKWHHTTASCGHWDRMARTDRQTNRQTDRRTLVYAIL